MLTAPEVGRAALSWEHGDSDPDLSRPPSREDYFGQQSLTGLSLHSMLQLP